jgi:hypothetical protein
MGNTPRLFQAPQSTLHGLFRRREKELALGEIPNLDAVELGGPNSYLTNREEGAVLQWIWDAQREKKCPSSPEVREFAESLRKQRVDDGRACKRSLWHSFKSRHPELKRITADGMENARCEVARRDVLVYFAEVKRASAQMRTAAQLLNMDETGFCSRPEKARERKAVYRTDCPVKPAFREESDPNHITLVATITFSGEAVKTRPKWVPKILRIHRSWHECAHRLTVRSAWSAAAITHTPSQIPEWRIDEIAIARKLGGQCRPQFPVFRNEVPDVQVATTDDVLRWLAGVGPRPNQNSDW